MAALAAVHLLLWPLFAADSLRRSFAVTIPHRSPEQEIDDIRGAFESAMFDSRSDKNVLEFRDTFARYTGLVIALRRTAAAGTPNDLFEVAGHSDRTLATRCLNRRNCRRLEFHLLNAKTEFDELVQTRRDLDKLTEKLARLLEPSLRS